MTTHSIEQFIADHLNGKYISDYCRTEARILNSFMRRMVADHGYSLRYVYDGEDTHVITDNDRFDALYHIVNVDSAVLCIVTPDTVPLTLHLCLGEGEALTIYDHSDMTDEQEALIFKVWADCVKTHDVQLYNDNWA